MLALAEFMELREKPLPIGTWVIGVCMCWMGVCLAYYNVGRLGRASIIHNPPTYTTTPYTNTNTPPDMRLLGQQAERAQAYAKCLKYKEREFHADPSPDCVEVRLWRGREVFVVGLMD